MGVIVFLQKPMGAGLARYIPPYIPQSPTSEGLSIAPKIGMNILDLPVQYLN